MACGPGIFAHRELIINQINHSKYFLVQGFTFIFLNVYHGPMLQAASKMKEIKTKTNKLFCKDLKMFGQCLKTNCPNRHVFMPELDESSTLPRYAYSISGCLILMRI